MPGVVLISDLAWPWCVGNRLGGGEAVSSCWFRSERSAGALFSNLAWPWCLGNRCLSAQLHGSDGSVCEFG